ncbi:MAG: DNA-binding transcriptional regulator Fis [Porticoccaceae bacterium]
MKIPQSETQPLGEINDLEPTTGANQQSLQDNVAAAMARYFEALDGQQTSDLYNLVMAEVEPPLLKSAMAYTRNNQSKTAALLGLNRGTLRKKLKQYKLI